MAIHQELGVGSVITTYHTVIGPDHMTGKYAIRFYVLFVQNRRERSSGELVPKNMESFLNALGIRTLDSHMTNSVTAIGCRSTSYFSTISNTPYPSINMLKTAREEYDIFIDNNDYDECDIQTNDFMNEFNKNEGSNNLYLFSLAKTPKQILTLGI